MGGLFLFPSANTERLFYEFLRRYQELKKKQKQETIFFVMIICLGLCSLLLPWVNPPKGFYLGFFLWALFYVILKQYLKLKDEVQYLFINVSVLYHHFLGRLEVGFCNHQGSCNCAANFKSYVWTKFGISFGKNMPNF